MNLKQRVIGVIGTVALCLSLGSGLVSAQSTDEADTNLNVTCPLAASVDVNVTGSFSVDSTHGTGTSADLPGGFNINLDLTCNWSNHFQVAASIGTFAYVGTVPNSNLASSFSGSLFSLTGGTSTYSGVTSLFPLAGAPDVQTNVFQGLPTSDPNVIQQGYLFIFPAAAPGVTSATWDGHLSFLPLNLAQGTYTAPLTVTLTVN